MGSFKFTPRNQGSKNVLPSCPMPAANSSSWRRRVAIIAASSFLLLSAAACAPQQGEAASTEGIDPAVAEAVAEEIKKEGPIQFVDVQVMETSLQAHLLKNVVTTLGGEAEVVTSGHAPALAAMSKADNMVWTDLWRWQFEDQWQEYVEKEKSIISIGNADYAGEEGWYVPTYVIKGDPERGIEPMCPNLPDWKALNECVDVFKTAKTGEKGQFMTGAESWAPLYGDQKRIDNLGLNYEMTFAGSEAALNAELQRAYEQGKPWLGLMWRPNYMTHKYDLTRVEFPPYTEECWGDTYACQWPETIIHQIASDDVPSKYPEVWKILQNYSINDEQLADLLAKVNDEGMSVEDAVKAWMEENPESWKAWI